MRIGNHFRRVAVTTLLFLILAVARSSAQTIPHKYQTGVCNGIDGTAAPSCGLLITAPASGAMLFVYGSTRVQHLGGASNDCTTGITDDKGNSYQNLKNVEFDTVNHIYQFVCYLPNVTNGPTTVTTTLNAASSSTFETGILEVNGVTTTPLDQTGADSLAPGCPGSCTNTTNPASASITTTNANEIIISTIATTSGTGTLSSPTNSFTIQQQLNSHINIAALSRIVTSTLTTSSGATVSVASEWSASVFSFIAPAAAFQADEDFYTPRIGVPTDWTTTVWGIMPIILTKTVGAIFYLVALLTMLSILAAHWDQLKNFILSMTQKFQKPKGKSTPVPLPSIPSKWSDISVSTYSTKPWGAPAELKARTLDKK